MRVILLILLLAGCASEDPGTFTASDIEFTMPGCEAAKLEDPEFDC